LARNQKKIGQGKRRKYQNPSKYQIILVIFQKKICFKFSKAKIMALFSHEFKKTNHNGSNYDFGKWETQVSSQNGSSHYEGLDCCASSLLERIIG